MTWSLQPCVNFYSKADLVSLENFFNSALRCILCQNGCHRAWLCQVSGVGYCASCVKTDAIMLGLCRVSGVGYSASCVKTDAILLGLCRVSKRMLPCLAMLVLLPCAASCVKADAIVLGYVKFPETINLPQLAFALLLVSDDIRKNRLPTFSFRFCFDFSWPFGVFRDD